MILKGDKTEVSNRLEHTPSRAQFIANLIISQILAIWHFADVISTKPEVIQNLGSFRQAENDTSKVSRGLTCQNLKQNGCLHVSP